MEIHTGIVLKTCYSQAPNMTVLDRQLGKIKGKVYPRNKSIRASLGSIIQYTFVQRGSLYIFEVIDFEYVPFVFACQDIFFLHHILELCYYFLPVGCAVHDVFDLVVYLFHIENNEKLRPRKCLILARLFSLFGIYPEHDKMSVYMNTVVSQPLDQLLDTSVDVQMNIWLDQWMWAFIMAHSNKEQFKTIRLLKRAESHES